jgi:hypothetical protein
LKRKDIYGGVMEDLILKKGSLMDLPQARRRNFLSFGGASLASQFYILKLRA